MSGQAREHAGRVLPQVAFVVLLAVSAAALSWCACRVAAPMIEHAMTALFSGIRAAARS